MEARGRSSTQDPKNQDSQHMQNQPRGSFPPWVGILDGRNRAKVIAVVASENDRNDSNHQRALAVISPPKNTEFDPRRPCVRCAAIRIARLAFVGVVFVPRGPAEWPARVDHVR